MPENEVFDSIGIQIRMPERAIVAHCQHHPGFPCLINTADPEGFLRRLERYRANLEGAAESTVVTVLCHLDASGKLLLGQRSMIPHGGGGRRSGEQRSDE